MTSCIGIVDLFSGPGGLGEGFSAAVNADGTSGFRTELAIENEDSAHATLRLRSFLRKFGGRFPDEYYEFLNGTNQEPDWSALWPDQWAEAVAETPKVSLGTIEADRLLSERLPGIRKKYGDSTILIGGPPCQAYSLVGRARNAGTLGYVAENDGRHTLYQNYVNVIEQLKPTVFVMENVKGMLSSTLSGSSIIDRVIYDLGNAAGPGSYRLFPLYSLKDLSFSEEKVDPRDFVIRSEQHGIPQARHRVIIVGVRTDVIASTPFELGGLEPAPQVNVDDVLDFGFPIRSGLSRKDNSEAWSEVFRMAITIVKDTSVFSADDKAQHILADCLRNLENGALLSRGSNIPATIPETCPNELARWLADPRVANLANHETRGHMASDLSRYLFASIFAQLHGRSPKASEFPLELAPNHKNWKSGKFADRFRVQVASRPATTITSHISKDGHYYIHPDPVQCRSLTVREAARLQTFPDNYFFKGNRTEQYVQVGNAVPPYLAFQIAKIVLPIFDCLDKQCISTTKSNHPGQKQASYAA